MTCTTSKKCSDLIWAKRSRERHERAPLGQALFSALFHIHLGSSGYLPPEENPDASRLNWQMQA